MTDEVETPQEDTSPSLADQLSDALGDVGQEADGTPSSAPSAAQPGGEAQPVVSDDSQAGASAEQTQEEVETALLSRFQQEFGRDFSPKYRSDRELMQGLLEAHHLVGRRNEEAEAFRQFAPYIGEFKQFLEAKVRGGNQTQPQAFPDAAPAQAPGAGDGRPEFDPNWQYLVERDANGNLVPKQGAPLDIPYKIQAYERWRQERAEKLLGSKFADDPEGYIASLVESKAQELVHNRLTEYQQQQIQQQQQAEYSHWVQEWTQNNKGWLFAGGNPQAGLSDVGREFTGLLNQATAMGMPEQAAVNHALALMTASRSQQPQPAAPNQQGAKRQPSSNSPATSRASSRSATEDVPATMNLRAELGALYDQNPELFLES